MNGYEAALATIMEIWKMNISQRKDKNDLNTVFFVGHDMAITDLANYLLQWDIWKISTCSVLTITFDMDDWWEIAQTQGKKISFTKPRDLTQ